MAKLLVSLDLSTTCTGYSIFNLNTGELLTYGKLKPTKQYSKETYPKRQLLKSRDLALQIHKLILTYPPTIILIEEVSGSKNRLGQKTLDGFHFIVFDELKDYLDLTRFFDVTGSKGWRTLLQLKLTDAEKQINKESKKINKKLPPKQQLPIIGPKHLACRYVNYKYGLNLNVDLDSTDSDVADSIAMANCYLRFQLNVAI